MNMVIFICGSGMDPERLKVLVYLARLEGTSISLTNGEDAEFQSHI